MVRLPACLTISEEAAVIAVPGVVQDPFAKGVEHILLVLAIWGAVPRLPRGVEEEIPKTTERLNNISGLGGAGFLENTEASPVLLVCKRRDHTKPSTT